MFRRKTARPPAGGPGAESTAQEKIADRRPLTPSAQRFLLEMHRNTVQDEEFGLFEEPISGWWSNDWVIDQEETRLDNP